MSSLDFVYFATCLLTLCTASDRGKPNILFIVADDLRPTLGCYSYPLVITPNIDKLASRSVVFQKAYSQVPWTGLTKKEGRSERHIVLSVCQQALCGPSRTSFLTGRRPDTTKLYDVHSYWRTAVGNYTTIPQHFKLNGYETVSFGKIFHPGIVSGKTYDYPYSWSEPPYIPSTRKYQMKKVCPGSDGKVYMNVVCPVNVSTQPEGTLPDIQTNEHAMNYLKKKAGMKRKPFFLAVGYYKPHIPFKYPQEFLNYYPLSEIDIAKDSNLPGKLPLVAWNPWTDLRRRDDVKRLNISFPYGPVPREFQRLMRQSYYAATTYMDDLVGQLLDTLNSSGFSNNTIVVFLGDHGWSLGEHQEWSKYSNYEVATRVPLIISVPGMTFCNSMNQSTWTLKTTNTCDALVELVDLFPTLAELAGLEIPKTCQPDPYKIKFCTEGSSLTPLLQKHSQFFASQTIENLYQSFRNRSFLKTQENGFHDLERRGYKEKKLIWKPAVFSQYPRPSLCPQNNSDQPKTTDIEIMGYTMRTKQFRYTEWIKFYPSNFSVNWDKVYGRELYNYNNDPDEDNNVVTDSKYEYIVRILSKKLHQGWRKALPIYSQVTRIV